MEIRDDSLPPSFPVPKGLKKIKQASTHAILLKVKDLRELFFLKSTPFRIIRTGSTFVRESATYPFLIASLTSTFGFILNTRLLFCKKSHAKLKLFSDLRELRLSLLFLNSGNDPACGQLHVFSAGREVQPDAARVLVATEPRAVVSGDPALVFHQRLHRIFI